MADQPSARGKRAKPVPPAVQQIAGLGLALELIDQASLLLMLRRLPVQLTSRRRADLRERIYQQAIRSHRLTLRLVAEITRAWTRSPDRPDPELILQLLARQPRKGLALGLMWAMGERIDDPAWRAAWNQWLEETAEWRKMVSHYPRYRANVEAMEIAEELVEDAESQARQIAVERDRLRQTLKTMAAACRRAFEELRGEIQGLREANERLSALRPLQGSRILICGDPSHETGYRVIVDRYGGQIAFADAARAQDVRAALSARYDAIVYVTAYGSHKTQRLLEKYAGTTPVFYANRGGLGEMERVIGAQVIPRLLRRSEATA